MKSTGGDKQPTPVEFGGQGPAGVWSAANTRVPWTGFRKGSLQDPGFRKGLGPGFLGV